MLIRRCLLFTGATACLSALVFSQMVFGQKAEEEWRRMLGASESAQTAWIESHLGAGMPGSTVFMMLILNRSEIALPLIEQKIEEVLRSPSPAGCFTDRSVDPQKFVDRAVEAIIEAGDLRSLEESSKLIKLDEQQFGWMVGRTLTQARSYRNSFTVAYGGFELGDPAVDIRIAAWVSEQLRARESVIPEAAEAEMMQQRGWLADALVDRYGAVPTEAEWAADPIVSRLPPAQAAWLHDNVMRAAHDAHQKRVGR